MFLRDDQRHRHIPRRLLYRVHQSVQGIEQIQMPGHQQIRSQQCKYHQRTAGCQRIADEHHPFLIPSVTECARKNTHHHIRRIGTDRKHRRLQRRPRLLIQPQRQCKSRHAASQLRQRLRAP